MPKLPQGIRHRWGAYYGRWYDERGVRKEVKLSRDLREAKRIYGELQRRADRAKAGIADETGEGISIEPLVAAFLADLKLRVVPSHSRDTETGLRRIIKLMGARMVADITPTEIAHAMQRIVSEGASNRTANKHLAYLVAWARWCVRTRRITRNPADGIARLPTSGRHCRHVRRRLTLEQARNLQEAADQGTAGDVVAIALGTGMRLGEIVRACWGHLEGDRIEIPANHTKTHRGRVVWIGSDLAARLKALRQRRALAAGEIPSPHEAICLNSRGKPWTIYGAYQALRRAIEKSPLEHREIDGSILDFHALRHTYATMLAGAGASQSVLQAQLGWETPSMAAIYVDASRAPAREAVAQMDAMRGDNEAGRQSQAAPTPPP